MKPYDLSVVMPVYNEAEAIGPVLKKWMAMLDTLGIRYRIRAYNDGSKDATGKILSEIADASDGRVLAVDKANSGHGPTILRGYREAAEDSEWVFQIDSDDEMGPESFPELWAKRNDYDFLVGRRDGRRQPLARKVVSFVSRLCVRLFYGKGIWDVNTLYRLMRAEIFAPFYAQIPDDTFAPNVILSGLAARHRLRLLEIPVPQHDRTTGEVSIKKWKLLKAAARSFAQTIGFAFHEGIGLRWLFVAMGVAVVGRLLFLTLGHNYDFDSYKIVSQIVLDGGTVYAETSRYNYGPLWFYVLAFLRWLSGDAFRLALALFLAAVDYGIAALLWRSRYRLAAVLFLLAPVGMFISGYHGQFDNVAVAIALLAVVGFGKERAKRDWLRVFGLGLTLGLSIMMKHVCAFFPLWLAFRERTWGKRVFILFFPVAVFLSGFLPYTLPELCDGRSLREGVVEVTEPVREFVAKGNYSAKDVSSLITDYKQWLKEQEGFRATAGIVKNVFLYQSGKYAILWQDFLPTALLRVAPPAVFFILAMIVLGWLVRRLPPVEVLGFYCAGLVCFSSSCAVQYFAIPILFAALFPNRWSVAYAIWGLPMCYCFRYGLFAFTNRRFLLADIEILFLALAIIVAYRSVSVARHS